MNLLPLSLSLVVLLSPILGVLSQKQAKDFFRKLESNSYDKNSLPVGNDGPGLPVKVLVSAYLLDVYKVEDSSLDFNAHFYFRQNWNDSRLKHGLSEDLVLNNVDNIWTPDLFFVEERQGFLHHIVHPNIFCRIKPNGEVLFSVRLSLKFGCPMDFRRYPHDMQKCDISIESYGFTTERIDLEWSSVSEPLGFEKNLKNLEFNLIDLEPSAEKLSFTFGNYSRLQMNMTFKRKFGYFLIGLYVPFVLLFTMALLSLWIKAEERILRLALLLVVMYLMVTISTSMNHLAPPAPYTKASDVWIGFCESLTFALLLEFIAAALVARGEGDKAKGDIPLALELDSKEDKLKSPLDKFMNMFDARKGGARNSTSLRIDKISRILFPIIFILFNIIYWTVYSL